MAEYKSSLRLNRVCLLAYVFIATSLSFFKVNMGMVQFLLNPWFMIVLILALERSEGTKAFKYMVANHSDHLDDFESISFFSAINHHWVRTSYDNYNDAKVDAIRVSLRQSRYTTIAAIMLVFLLQIPLR